MSLIPGFGRNRTRIDVLCFIGITLTSACAPATTSHPGGFGSRGGAPNVAMRSSDRVSHLELIGTEEPNAFEALRRIRPDLFRARKHSRGESSAVLPAVYIGSIYQGDITVLQGMTPDVVREVYVVPAMEAAFRFGREHPAGALIVTLRLR